MKKIIILMIIAIIPAILSAQSTPFSSLYDRYVTDPGFESSEILPGSMNFEWEKNMTNEQVKKMLSSIGSIRMLKYRPGEGKINQDKLWKKMQKAAGEDQYKEVVTVNADKVSANVFILPGNGGNTKEIALLERDENGIVMVTVTGDMDFSSMFSPENMKAFREMGEYFMKNKMECNMKAH